MMWSHFRRISPKFGCLKKTSKDVAQGTEFYQTFSKIIEQTNKSLRGMKELYENIGKLAIETAKALALTSRKMAASMKGVGEICQGCRSIVDPKD